MTDADPQLAKLPEAARSAFARALSASANSGDAQKYAGEALAAVGIPVAQPGRELYPLASSYDDVQRAALEYSARQNLGTFPYACPAAAKTRLRWLGVVPGGVLETQTVSVTHDGVTTTEPLWRALQLAREVPAQAAILDGLPFDVVLRALFELHGVGFGYRINHTLLFPHGNLRLLRELKDEAREWAIAQADAFATGEPPTHGALKLLVLFALVRAKVPIEPKWELLFCNVVGATKDLLFECARALPEARRAAVVGPHLNSIAWAVEMVAEFPSDAMVRALLANVAPNSVRWNFFVDALRKLGETNPEVLRAVEALVAAAPKPIELYVTTARKPKTQAELTPLEREQLRLGLRGYEEGLDPEERVAPDASESEVPGDLEIRNIADGEGNALYDALRYLADAGVIYRAGTTEEIAGLAQGGVVLGEKNEALRTALQVAVGPAPLTRKAKAKRSASAKPTKSEVAKPTKPAGGKPTKTERAKPKKPAK